MRLLRFSGVLPSPSGEMVGGELSSLREGMGMGLGCEGMGMGCGGCLSQLLVQRYKINQRAPNNRAKITEKSEKGGFRCGCNVLTIK